MPLRLFALLVLFSLSSVRHPRAQVHFTVDTLSEAWAEAPPGRWYTRGGSASRSGATLTAIPRSQPFVAWSRDLGGTIEGEPLAWDELLIVAVATGEAQRTLFALDRQTGSVLDKMRFKTGMPLCPSMWGDRIAVRAEPGSLQLLELGPSDKKGHRRLAKLWEHELTGTASAPLLLGNELYVTAAGQLTRLTPGARQPVVWSRGPDFHGRPSLRGDAVYSLRYTAQSSSSWLQIVQCDRLDGTEQQVFNHATIEGLAELVASPVDLRIAVLASSIHVYSETPLRLLGTTTGDYWSQSFGTPRASTFDVDYVSYLGAVKELVQGAGQGPYELVLVDNPEPRLSWHQHIRDSEGRLVPMGDEGSHETSIVGDLTRCTTALTLAGSYALVGPVAILLDENFYRSRGRAWRAPVEPTMRLIPVRDGLLAVTGTGTLNFLESPSARVGSSIEPLEDEVVVKQGRAVLRSGKVVTGELHFNRGQGLLSLQGRRRVEGSWPLDEVQLLEDNSDSIIYTPDEFAAERALDRLIALAASEETTALLVDGRKCRDPQLLSELVASAGFAGGDFDAQTHALLEIDRSLKRAKLPDDDLIHELTPRREALAGLANETLWAHLDQLDHGPLWTTLARRAVAEQPQDPRLHEALAQLLPPAMQPETESDPEGWLELGLAARAIGANLVLEAEPGSPSDEQELSQLTAIRAKSHEQLVAWRTANTYVMAPLRQPLAMAFGLAMGELVPRALRTLLGGRVCRPDEGSRTSLLLTQDPAEYSRLLGYRDYRPVDISVKRLGRTSALVVYLPEGFDPQRTDVRSLVTLLAKSWLSSQCPSVLDQDKNGGAWISRGLAMAVAEMQFDTLGHTWTPTIDRPWSLDIVAGATESQLFDWTILSRATTNEVRGLAGDTRRTDPTPPVLQFRGPEELSIHDLFSAQAAAAVHYLISPQGGSRGLDLGRALEAYNQAQGAPPSFQQLLGATPEQLGVAVHQWCQQLRDELLL